MPSNIEIKARARDFEEIRRRAIALSDTPGETIEQTDTFFNSPQGGRLKLRILGAERGELIFYERPDVAGPKTSVYVISRTSEPDTLAATLEAALGAIGVVRKRRILYIVGQTRVHLDDVDGLGRFVELEVVLAPGQPAEEGEAIARRLMEQLAIASKDLVEGAYFDMMDGQTLQDKIRNQ